MRLYFLGLDGLACSIVFDEAQKGRWPNLERLWQESLYGECDCEENYVFTGPSWTSIYTGQPAQVHGLTDLWGRPINGSRAFPTVKEPYLWEILNRHGITCGVVTMPITYPARTIKDYMIAGFPSPKLSVTGAIAVPEGFLVDHSEAIRLTKRIPGIGFSWHDEMSLEEDLEHLRKVELGKVEVVRSLLEQRSTDTLFVQYSCLDRVGHELNNYARRGQPFDYRHVYEMYDWFDAELLPKLLEVEADYLVIVSDHGWPRWCEGQGSHDLHGVFLARGPDIPQGMRSECRNIDVMPTTLDILELPPEAVAGHSVLLRQSDLEAIDHHLEGLGYL